VPAASRPVWQPTIHDAEQHDSGSPAHQVTTPLLRRASFNSGGVIGGCEIHGDTDPWATGDRLALSWCCAPPSIPAHGKCLDHPDYIFSPVALAAGELDQITNLAQDGTSLCLPVT